MNLEIRHLKLIAAIAETGSMTRAGNCLHLTQSALSHQLRDVEEQLGVPLFERGNRKMTLTPAGRRLLESARTVIAELESAQQEIKARKVVGQGLIRLSTECYTVYHWLPARLKLFQRKFPSVEFQLVVEATDNPFEALLEGQLDVAIACTQMRNRKIRYTPLFEDEMLVIARRAAGLRRRDRHHLSAERREYFTAQNSGSRGNLAEKDSGSDVDGGDRRNGQGRTRFGVAGEVGRSTATRFRGCRRKAADW
jgi:LysR family transcriptional regulator for metE and metH